MKIKNSSVKKGKSQNRKEYKAPNIEVIRIEFEQNLFAGSGDLPGYPGEDW